jgi:glycosyltransferase involved in cell wall biosynthesis
MPAKQSLIAEISVIIPAYRSAKTIGRALTSIAGQTVRPREVIVVDDGSDDGTAEVARSFADRINGAKLMVIEQENHGAGAARNRGLEAASEKWVAFLDADDEWVPEKLERSLDVMAETGAVLVSHDFIRVEDGKMQKIDCARHFKNHRAPFIALYLRGNIATSTVLVERRLVDQAGCFDHQLPSGQDIDLWLAITARKDVRFHIFGEALARYHVTADSISSRTAERRRCAMIILLRHAAALRGRGRGGKLNALVRAAIICRQAAASFQGQGKPAAAFAALVSAPFTVLKVGGIIYSTPLAWLWVVGVTGAYAHQFQIYIKPVLSLLGFK